mgnify:FL=1
MDGLCSNITYMYVTVDTVAPQISFNNEFETYEEGIYLHGICSKDTIEVWLDGEYVYMSDVPDFGIYFELAPGEHKMVFELYDRCGNKTTEEIAALQYIATSTVRSNRSRLRQKLQLNQETDLQTFLSELIKKDFDYLESPD